MDRAIQFKGFDHLAYVDDQPTCSALYKCWPEDFKVDEQLGFEPNGKGQHLMLRIRKKNLSTLDVAKSLSTELQVGARDIGYSGMKDRRASTSQWFSVQLDDPESLDPGELTLMDMEVLESHRNSRKLKVGSHKANSFKLVLRDVSGNREELEQRLVRIREQGVPNYFGGQRFGREFSNLQQLQQYLGEDGQPEIKGRAKRSMLYSAARAFVFNNILSQRLEQGSWNQYLEGDVLNLAGTQRSFLVDPDGWDEQLQSRLQEQDIHITGLLPGSAAEQDKYATRGLPADIEQGVLDELSVLAAALSRWGLKPGRRPLRFRVDGLAWSWLEDNALELQFVLPRGAYATSLLREICKVKESTHTN